MSLYVKTKTNIYQSMLSFIMEQTIIPKDCVVCDSCNTQLSDGNFIASADSVWYTGDLICEDCDRKYEYGKSYQVVRVIKKGDDLSKTDLAKPIIMEFDF